MKQTKIIFSLIMLMALGVMGQNEVDALRYSYFTPVGTARFNSMGGAFGALGGDFSSLSTNPAGLAVYRSGEFTITPTIGQSVVNSTFYGTDDSEFKYGFNISNLGLVVVAPQPDMLDKPGWRGFHFGFGMNQLANFSNHKVYQGFNTDSSFLTHMLDDAFETGIVNQFDEQTTRLAWDTYLIDIDTLSNGFVFDDFVDRGNIQQRGESDISGSIRELNVSFGANYSDRIYLGASFGFPIVRFNEHFFYTEDENYFVNQDGELELNSFFEFMEYKTHLKTRGSGFNFKLGGIFRVNDMVRLGAAMHSPTFYSLTDTQESEMAASHWPVLSDGFEFHEAVSRTRELNYEVTTPLRLTGSLALIFGNLGLVSFDYEYTDYSQMRLNSSNVNFRDQNQLIRSNFGPQHNVRAGGELRLDPLIFRGGYALYTSPYKDEVNDGSTSIISGGLGLRDESYFVDFGFTYALSEEDYFPYSPARTAPIQYQYARSTLMMTVGFRF